MKRIAGLMLALGLLAAACTKPTLAAGPSASASSSPSPSPVSSEPSASPSPPGPDLGSVHVHLQKIATLDQPLGMAVRAGDDGLYIAEKTGRIVALRNGNVDPAPVLDLSSKVSGGGERGLLGLAFSADGGSLYVNYTDLNGDTNVVEYAMSSDGRADSATARRVLFVKQPYANHNGGNVIFGPDGYLYIGMGDGGSAGDPQGNGQSLVTLLGKMLRIDPRPTGGKPYGVPPDNPFAGRTGGVRPEIWAYGLRNPWRWSFDRETGDLWIGDVGQGDWEEVDFQPAGSNGGQNYGWNRLEGTHPYLGATPPKGAVPPIYEYSHALGGCAVTGGYVYRGGQIPGLWGAYLFIDYCGGALTALVQRGGRVVQKRVLARGLPLIASFGQDHDGELYLLSLQGAVYKLTP